MLNLRICGLAQAVWIACKGIAFLLGKVRPYWVVCKSLPAVSLSSDFALAPFMHLQ